MGPWDPVAMSRDPHPYWNARHYDGVPTPKINMRPGAVNYVKRSLPLPTPEELTNQRKSTHGDWNAQATMASELKTLLRDGESYDRLTIPQREALDMIAVKLSRIVEGNPAEPDHWDDIAGYAFLAKGGHKEPGLQGPES